MGPVLWRWPHEQPRARPGSSNAVGRRRRPDKTRLNRSARGAAGRPAHRPGRAICLPFWPSDCDRRSAARNATPCAAASGLRPRDSSRAAPLPGRWENFTPGPGTPRRSCRSKSPVPVGKQVRAATPLAERNPPMAHELHVARRVTAAARSRCPTSTPPSEPTRSPAAQRARRRWHQVRTGAKRGILGTHRRAHRRVRGHLDTVVLGGPNLL